MNNHLKQGFLVWGTQHDVLYNKINKNLKQGFLVRGTQHNVLYNKMNKNLKRGFLVWGTQHDVLFEKNRQKQQKFIYIHTQLFRSEASRFEAPGAKHPTRCVSSMTTEEILKPKTTVPYFDSLK